MAKYDGQRQRLLALLKERKWQRINIRDIIIGQRMLQYSSRIYELRKKWYTIINKIERETNSFWERVKHGFFKLVRDPDGEQGEHY